MNILKKSLTFSLGIIAALCCSGAESVKLENDYMKIIVEPDAGARISSWELKKFPEKIVKTWNRIKSGRKIKKAKKAIYSGGALGGHMCGAYQDEQLDAAGVGADLIRLSCGLENAQDLLDDIAQALTFV